MRRTRSTNIENKRETERVEWKACTERANVLHPADFQTQSQRNEISL